MSRKPCNLPHERKDRTSTHAGTVQGPPLALKHMQPHSPYQNKLHTNSQSRHLQGKTLRAANNRGRSRDHMNLHNTAKLTCYDNAHFLFTLGRHLFIDK